MSDEELVREALRIYRRYASEIVEALGLCPWAERARLDGKTQERIVLSPPGADTLRTALETIAELAAEPKVEIGLVIFPELALPRLDFERMVAQVQEADARRHPLGEQPFAMAGFHPDSGADLSHAERLIPFLRRSPDPTIQLVRCSVLDRVRGSSPQGTAFVDPSTLDPLTLTEAKPSLRERIAEANLQTVRTLGVAEIEAILADIRRDRDESYARARTTGRARGSTLGNQRHRG
jgi:hypothetical protein